MKAELNPVFSAVRGRMGDLVFYTCGESVRARSYTVPRDPRTALQRVRREAFASAVWAWSELPDEDEYYAFTGYNPL